MSPKYTLQRIFFRRFFVPVFFVLRKASIKVHTMCRPHDFFDQQKRSALHFAAEAGHGEVVQRLVCASAKQAAVCKSGVNPIFVQFNG